MSGKMSRRKKSSDPGEVNCTFKSDSGDRTQPEGQSETLVETQPEAQSETQPVAQSEAQSETQPDMELSRFQEKVPKATSEIGSLGAGSAAVNSGRPSGGVPGNVASAGKLHMLLSQPSSSPSHDSYMQNITSPQQATCDDPSVDIALVGRMSSKYSEGESIEFNAPVTSTPVEDLPMEDVPLFEEAIDTGGTSEILLPSSTFPAVKVENDSYVTGTEFTNTMNADHRENANKYVIYYCTCIYRLCCI